MSILLKPNQHLFFLTVVFGTTLGCAGCDQVPRADACECDGRSDLTRICGRARTIGLGPWAPATLPACRVERSLRVFQRTLITKIPHCGWPEADFIARFGCAHRSNMEIIKFVEPAEFRYGFRTGREQRLPGKVYEIIAVSERFRDGTGRVLLGLGFRVPGTRGRSQLNFSPVIVNTDLLGLDSGECSEADASRVPSAI
jgi:hypothetical protein